MIVAPPGFRTARRPRPRWGRRIGIAALALLVALGGVWWFSKRPVEAALRAKLVAALEKRGFAVALEGLEWNRMTDLRLTGLVADRADVHVEIDTLDVTASGRSLMGGELKILALHLGPTRATVRIDQGASATPDPASASDATPGLRALAPGAHLTVARLDATVERAAVPLATLRLTGPTLTIEPQAMGLVGIGELTLDGRTAPVRFEARREPGRVFAEARSTSDDAPLVELADPAHGRIRIGGGAVERTAGRLEAKASAIDVQLGPATAPIVRLAAARGSFSSTAGIVFERGSAQAWADPRAALPHARALYRSWRGGPSAGPDAPTAGGDVADRRLQLKAFELIAADGWKMIDARLDADGDTVTVDGGFGGGRLKIALEGAEARVEAEAVRLAGRWAEIPLAGVLSGTVTVARDPLRLTIAGRVDAGELHHPAIAEAPVKGIDAGFEGTVTVSAGQVGFTDARIRLGKAHATVSLSIGGLPADPLTLRAGWPADLKPIIDLSAKVDPIPCQDAVAALPGALLGPLAKVRLSGFFRPEVKLRLPFKDPTRVRLTTQGISKGGCEVDALELDASGRPPADVAAPLDDVAWLDADFVLPVREGTSEGTTVQVGPGTPGWVPLAEMPAYVGGAAYLSEEMGFYTGTGISLPLIAKALGTNLTHGRFVYGGSTVTQQLVKNLFLTRRKTLARKLQEAIISARIARAVSKDRVLELYLNCIEFGPDLYGIGPAAEHYFQKPASALTPLEAVFLAMLKPAPRRGAWYRRAGRTPKMPYWDERVRLLLERLEARSLVPAGTADAAVPFILRWDGEGRYLGPDRPEAAPIEPDHAPDGAEAPLEELP